MAWRVLRTHGSGTRKLVEELFAKAKCTPNILMETSNTEFIKQLVHRGEGVSFLVREAVVAELKNKNLVEVPLKGHKILLDVSIAYLKRQVLSPPARASTKALNTDMSPREASVRTRSGFPRSGGHQQRRTNSGADFTICRVRTHNVIGVTRYDGRHGQHEDSTSHDQFGVLPGDVSMIDTNSLGLQF